MLLVGIEKYRLELKNIVKSELISETWKVLNKEYKKTDVENIVNAFIDSIAMSIKNGHNVKIEGLGTFSAYFKNVYMKKTLDTCITETIPKVKCISFKPSKKLK